MKNFTFFKTVALTVCSCLAFWSRASSQNDSATIIRNIMTSTRTSPTAEATPKESLVSKPFTLVSNEIRVFPSSNPQSEIHLSVNKLYPYWLLLSSNTLVANSYQGAWWSLNSGSSWTGAETMPNNSSGRNDPSEAFSILGQY
jgi:hypothetical protein